MTHFEKTISTERVYDGRIIKVRKDIAELENGAQVDREVVEHPGGVGILAVDEQENVLFVRQFRYGAGKVLLELPAGKLEYGEDPLACGKRELQEECGCTADEWSALCPIIPTPAYDSEVIYLFLAQGLHFSKQNLDEDEFLTVEKISLEKAVQLALSGEIPDAKTQAGLLQIAVQKVAGTIEWK